MFAQQLVNGIMLGSIYMLVAVAFTLAIGVLNFLNFSIPGLFMVGGMISWAMLSAGYHWSIAIAAALAAATGVALLVERLAYRRSQESDPEVPLASGLGFLILLENLFVVRYGSDQQSFPSLIPDFNIRAGSLVVGGAQLVSLVVAVTLVAWLSVLLKATNTGRRIRCVAESRDTALVLGVNVGRLVPQVFASSAVFTAAGGVLFALNYLQVSASMGEGVGFKGIAAMIVGGMGSIWGAILGGLLIGVTEVMTIRFLGADVVDITVYGLLLALLILRPEGLLGRPALREKL